MYACYYLWVGAEAFLFLDRRGAALQMGLVAVAYAWALQATVDTGALAQRWIMVMGTTVVIGLLVAYLRARLVALLGRLSAVARTDELTGIPNRRAFEERFEQELARGARDAQPLSVLVGDLDCFKLINDCRGHQEGDEVLRRVAAELEERKRLTDVAARVGGEEFALLLPATAHDEAEQVAERLRLSIREAFAGGDVPLSISFGVAAFPVHATDGEGVLRCADQALYSAKETGRDRTVVYSEDTAAPLEERAPAPRREQRDAAGHGGRAWPRRWTSATPAPASTRARWPATPPPWRAGWTSSPTRVERVELAGPAARRGQDRHLRPGADQARPAGRRGVGADAHPSPDRRPAAVAARARRPARLGVAHHERPDGRGYPFGLSGDEIPLEARILAVADAYEAMTADRVYKRAMAHAAARAELLACAGTQFDGEVVDVFLEALDARGGRLRTGGGSGRVAPPGRARRRPARARRSSGSGAAPGPSSSMLAASRSASACSSATVRATLAASAGSRASASERSSWGEGARPAAGARG